MAPRPELHRQRDEVIDCLDKLKSQIEYIEREPLTKQRRRRVERIGVFAVTHALFCGAMRSDNAAQLIW